MKKIMIFLLALCCLTGCSQSTPNTPISNDNVKLESTPSDLTLSENENYQQIITANQECIYSDEDVYVAIREKLSEPITVCNVWSEAVEEDMLVGSDLIAKVTVNDIKEIEISYEFMGTECYSYKSLATVSVDKIYNDSTYKVSNNYTIAIPNSSYSYDAEFPEIKINESYIFFASSPVGLNDSLKLVNYADFYIGGPADIIVINGKSCNSDYVFREYSNSATPKDKIIINSSEIKTNEINTYSSETNDYSNYTGRYTMSLSDFEINLQNKIKNLGGLYEN